MGQATVHRRSRCEAAVDGRFSSVAASGKLYRGALGSRGSSHAGKTNESPANDSSIEFLRRRMIDPTAANVLF